MKRRVRTGTVKRFVDSSITRIANAHSSRPRARSPIGAVCLVLLLALVGCGPNPQEEYDEALRQVNREEERLDNLRPAYDAARKTATEAVYKEITGGTPEESTQSTLEQLENIAAGAGKQPEGEKKGDDLDRAIEQLTAMQNTIESSQSVLLGGGKINEVMTKIKTPGTPEAKRLEEVFAAMPEVQAYQRQEKRLERAKQAALAAEAKLSD